jgi:hypothetical protein
VAKFEISASEIAALNRELARRSGVIGKGMQEVIEAEAKPLARDLVNLTTQSSRGSAGLRSVAPQSDRKRGERAIDSDINRMFLPLKKIEAVYNPKTRRFADVVQTMLESNDYEGIADLLESTGILDFHPKIILSAESALHRKFRVKSTGKVSKAIRNPWLVVNEKSIDELKKKLKANVGFAKSGWRASLRGVSLAVPRWIDKSGPGEFKADNGKDKYSITMGNSVDYMQKKAGKIVSRAIQARTESLRKRTEHLLSKAVK